MSRAARARRIAATAAYGGGGALGLAGGTVAFLKGQAMLARRRVGTPTTEPFSVSGWYGPSHRGGDPLRLVVLGDSAAAGLGADTPADTPAVVVATGLAAVSGRPVSLVSLAVVGAQTSGLYPQVERALDLAPDVAVIVVGANDVTHAVPPRTSVRHLGQVVRQLVDGGCAVVVGCCPDLGTVEPLPEPLRTIGRRWSRMLAAAQAIATVEAGGRAVSLADLLGPEFAARPGEYFSADRFHPSSLGYRHLGAVLLPSVCAALGFGPDPDAAPVAARGEHVAPIAEVAAEAAEHGGAEVVATTVGGRDRSRAGRWATLRRRIPIRRPPEPSTDPSDPASPHPEE
jgi:lysophospholipase L1-like esterase